MESAKKTEKQDFAEEWAKTLTSLKASNATYKEFRYFLNLGKEQADRERLKELRPKVILLGHPFPEEIIRGLGEQPFYLLGGSFSCASQAEHMVPRDTDSAIKSILGMLTDPELELARDALVLLPLNSDSMRKLPDLLGDRVRLIPYEVPEEREDPLQKERWTEEIFRVTLELEKHLHRRLSGRALHRECRISERAAGLWREFFALCCASSNAVSGAARLWIAGSIRWSADREEWCDHLERLTAEIRLHKQQPETPHLHVMLMGSPIYAPNYKVPLLIEEMGLENYAMVHPDFARLQSARPVAGKRNVIIRQLALHCLQTDMSPAYISNRVLEEKLRYELDRGTVHGIVAHILKGQIEYDFELNRLEKLIADYQLPVFRLETDYHYQDVEQLRIRLEAFAEMLRHRAAMGSGEARRVKKAI